MVSDDLKFAHVFSVPVKGVNEHPALVQRLMAPVMGRKPNQLVFEFFDRGTKLNNGSNRYMQTCKACGEVFPKGRIETLLSHLKKSCPSISQPDRRRALLQLQELPESENGFNTDLNEKYSNKSQRHHQHKAKLPAGEAGKLTGLEALAEASRQIGCPSKSTKSASKHDPLIDPSLEGEILYHESSGNHNEEPDETGNSKICV